MLSAKDFAYDFERKARPPHHRGAGKSSELFDSHGREQTQLTTGNEEDLPDLSSMQVMSLPRIPPLGRGREGAGGGAGGEGQHCTIQKHNARMVSFYPRP